MTDDSTTEIERTAEPAPRRYQRRALLLGAAGAGVAATVMGADRASADTGDTLILGALNVADTTTFVSTSADDCFEATTSANGKSAFYGTDDSTGGGNGVFGQSTNGWGVSGLTKANGRSAVVGNDESAGGGYGVTGNSTNGAGVQGASSAFDAIVGTTQAEGFAGVRGIDESNEGGYGVVGTSQAGFGVFGSSATNNAIHGEAYGDGYATILGIDKSTHGGSGVAGESEAGVGVSGTSAARGQSGVAGEDTSTDGGYGVSGVSANGTGVLGFTSSKNSIGVTATNSHGRALVVEGIATFSRSGRAVVAGKKGKSASSVTVKGTAVTAGSLVLATPQTVKAGVAVAGVVVNVKKKSFTIHLTKPVKSSFALAWFVLG
jgi:hypothetical protein